MEMTETTMPNILFVINPKAGSEKKNHQLLIQNYCKTLPWSVHFYEMTGLNDGDELDKSIVLLKPATIAAVGGDGTISLVAKKILGTSINLAIIPAGSANGMAKELNISTDMNDALTLLKNGQIKRADVLMVNNILCIHLSDIGLNAQLIKYFEQDNLRGKWGYAKLALKVFFRRQNMWVNICTADQVLKRNTLMVVIANASKYGTGAVINPKGDLYDGLFEVVIIKQIGLLTLLKMWLNPSGFSPDHIEVIQTNKVIIQTKKRMHFQVDGEYIGKVQKVNAKILQAQLNIIVPKGT